MAEAPGIITTVGAIAIGGVLVFFVAWIIGNALVIEGTTLVNYSNFPIVFTLIPVVVIAVFGALLIGLFR